MTHSSIFTVAALAIVALTAASTGAKALGGLNGNGLNLSGLNGTSFNLSASGPRWDSSAVVDLNSLLVRAAIRH